jgi:AcrR family transcriptional regulator
MLRRSPLALTLAEVATEAGLAPATLIHRFGTKRNLLLANCKAWTGAVAGQFAAAREQRDSPLETLVGFLADSEVLGTTPESIANSFAYLQIDLTDPEFRVVLLAQFVTMEAETRRLLDDAVAFGELEPCDTAVLARLVQQTHVGAMLEWAVYCKGPLKRWMRRSLRSLLQPYRATERPQGPRKRS